MARELESALNRCIRLTVLGGLIQSLHETVQVIFDEKLLKRLDATPEVYGRSAGPVSGYRGVSSRPPQS